MFPTGPIIAVKYRGRQLHISTKIKTFEPRHTIQDVIGSNDDIRQVDNVIIKNEKDI